MAVILVVEDEPVLARNLQEALEFHGYDVTSTGSGEQGLELAETLRPNVVITDLRLPGALDGLELLRRIQRLAVPPACVVITAHGDINTAVTAMKAGAADFLTKPLDLHELCITVERVLRRESQAIELGTRREMERAVSAVDGILGNCPQIREVRSVIRRIAGMTSLASKEPPCVLITGETGTGKDLAARAIHYAGPRRDGPFVHVNCTAIPEQLAESELFGHVKGAFTGAATDKRGLFEAAEGGTLFLDEIGHMSPALQAKLLTAIDHRASRAVGGARERRFNVHVIAATNRCLEDAIEAGEFRSDLFHRLRLLTLSLPPLRERGEDCELLARHFLHEYAARAGVDAEEFSPDAIEAIRAYDWPGNVRELSHTIERAVLMTDSSVIRAVHLNLQQPETGNAEVHLNVQGNMTIQINFDRNCPTLEEIEYRIILAALKFSSHNISRAARILGISRDAVRYRLERYRRRYQDSGS